MSQQQKYADLITDLHNSIKGMDHNLEELKKPKITSEHYMEIMNRIERFNIKCAAIPAEIKKMNIPKDTMLEIFQKTKFRD
jgi:hypothetical protein